MESPGEYLKRERELRGVSLKEIFEATRVPMRFLEAIEADRTDVLPHKAFVKGFIRSYCKVLGLDETDAVLRYEVYMREREAEAASVERTAMSGPPRAKRKPQPLPLKRPKSMRMYVFIAAAVFIIAAAYAVSLKKDSPVETAPAGQGSIQEDAPPPPLSPAPGEEPSGEPGPAEKAPEPVVAAPVPAEAKPERAGEKDAKGPAASADAVTEASGSTHTLTANASEMVWMKIGIDGGEPKEVLLREGERFTWKGSRGFSVVVGNAGGVTLTYNGRELPALGAQGEVIMLDLPSGGLQKVAPENAA